MIEENSDVFNATLQFLLAIDELRFSKRKIGSDRRERLMCYTLLIFYGMILCSRGAEESRRTSRGISRKTSNGGGASLILRRRRN